MHILSTSCIFSAKSILGKRFEANAPFVILIKLRYQLNIQHLHVHNFTHTFVRIIWKKYKLVLKKNGRNQLLLNNISTRAGYLVYGVSLFRSLLG